MTVSACQCRPSLDLRAVTCPWVAAMPPNTSKKHNKEKTPTLINLLLILCSYLPRRATWQYTRDVKTSGWQRDVRREHREICRGCVRWRWRHRVRSRCSRGWEDPRVAMWWCVGPIHGWGLSFPWSRVKGYVNKKARKDRLLPVVILMISHNVAVISCHYPTIPFFSP